MQLYYQFFRAKYNSNIPKGMIEIENCIKPEKKKRHPAENAFLTNPVASATDFTGYGINMPMTEDEADSLSEMFEDVPTEKSRLGDDSSDK